MAKINLNPNKQPVKETTQAHLEVEDIRNDMIFTKSGNVCVVLETTAVNFDLLSEEEQDAKIMSFAGLINSLNFQMQILIMTRRVDISNYLDYLQSFRGKQTTPGLKRQMEIYTHFVRNLIVKNDVLNKRFFIVIPFRSINKPRGSAKQALSTLKAFPGKKKKDTKDKEKEKQFTEKEISKFMEQARNYLYPKRDHVIKQLNKSGVSAKQLDTMELVRLFFNAYNQEEFVNEVA